MVIPQDDRRCVRVTLFGHASVELFAQFLPFDGTLAGSRPAF